MPLLVQELVVGSTNSSSSSTQNLQKCPAKPIAITAVTNPTSIPMSRTQSHVVAIPTVNHSRLNVENGSRLAEALAGNMPYSYTASSIQIAQPIQTMAYGDTNNANGSRGTNITPVPSNHRYYRYQVTPRQSYQLPFLLQDHNYGAPPPQSPPHSPPMNIPNVTVTQSQTNNYKNHVIGSPVKGSMRRPSDNIIPRTCVIEQVSQQINPVPPVMVTSSGNPSNSSASHFMASMPAHQQQFMPQPKTLMFSQSHDVYGRDSKCDPVSSVDTDEESRLSDRSSTSPSGEETETCPEGDGEDDLQSDDSITRCVCDLTHDDGYMIQCDRCNVWQHVDCMEIDRNNIPDDYLCEACSPRQVNKVKARSLQLRRVHEIRKHLASRMSSSDSEDNCPRPIKHRLSQTKVSDRKVLKKKKTKLSRDAKLPRKIQPIRKSSTSSVLNGSLPASISVSSASNEQKEKPIKLRRRSSAVIQEMTEEISQDVTLEQAKSWAEDYEVAVTNHYSPELRAKIQSTRIPNGPNKFSESTDGAIMGHRCKAVECTDANSECLESKVLMATMKIKAGVAILEYQGKYMLESQWSGMQVTHSFWYLPFVLKYNMVKEDLPLYIDARTYGNDARFARRSANYNAEIKHVLKRGSVHLYIVATKDIEEEEEILLSLDTAVCSPTYKPPKKCPVVPIPEETVVPSDTQSSSEEVTTPRKNGFYQNKKNNAKKSCLTVALPPAQSRVTRRTSDSCEELVSLPLSPVKQRRLSGVRSPVKSPAKSPTKSKPESPSSVTSPTYDRSDSKDDQKPMSREERKLAAYIKAFERMEKLTQRRRDSKKKKSNDKYKDDASSMEEDDGSADDAPKTDHHRVRKRGNSTPSKNDHDTPVASDCMDKILDSVHSAPCHSNGPFRFPKTKKALMNEWLNETVDPVLPAHASPGFETTGVPSCYMRGPTIATRRMSGPANISSPQHNTEVTGTSAKKRWLRQARIDENEPVGFNFCPSPNSRPDSPNGSGDYTTPLKKRRLARESMSSEQSFNSPPNTPCHPDYDEEKFNSEEIEKRLKDGEELPFEIDGKIKLEDLKKEPKDSIGEFVKSEHISKVVKRSPKKSPYKTKQFGSRKRKKKVKSEINEDLDIRLCGSQNMEVPDSTGKIDVKIESAPEKTILPRNQNVSLDVNDNKSICNVTANSCLPKEKLATLCDSNKLEKIPEPIVECKMEAINIELKPAPIKKKLSILEYRKRKSISCERDSKEVKENGDSKAVGDIPSNFVHDSKPSLPPVVEESGTDKIVQPLSPISNLSFTPSPPHSPTPGSFDKGGPNVKGTEIKWSEEPTLLEQQRENLTARLRREFGLCIPEDDQARMKLCADGFASSSFLEMDTSVGEPSTTPPHSAFWGEALESELQRTPSPFYRGTTPPLIENPSHSCSKDTIEHDTL